MLARSQRSLLAVREANLPFPVKSGKGPSSFPALFLQICPRMPGPLPRWLTGCAYPFLPLSHRPSPYDQWVGSTTTFRSTTSERVSFTRLQSFDNLQASEFAATQVVPTAGIQCGCRGGRGVYIRAERGSLPNRGRVGDWRAGLGRSLCSLLPRPFGCEVSQHLDRAYVSSPRHVERSVWISLTTLTCLLRIKGYGTYPAGATFGCGRRTL